MGSFDGEFFRCDLSYASCLLTATWWASQGQNQILAQIQNATPNSPQPPQDRRRDADRTRDGRRASQAGGAGVVPPSPALVRHGSKQHPAALTPGGMTPGDATPLSAAAQMNVSITQRRASQQPSGSQHPYASAGYDSFARTDEYSASQQAYGRVSPMVSSVLPAPPALSNVRAVGGEVGTANGGDYHGQQHAPEPPRSSLWQILMCHCR